MLNLLVCLVRHCSNIKIVITIAEKTKSQMTCAWYRGATADTVDEMKASPNIQEKIVWVNLPLGTSIRSQVISTSRMFLRSLWSSPLFVPGFSGHWIQGRVGLFAFF
jgi:hypothetical protein